jgi:hypothetical protein
MFHLWRGFVMEQRKGRRRFPDLCDFKDLLILGPNGDEEVTVGWVARELGPFVMLLGASNCGRC